ncbi:MAG: DUF433 domain-containing protein [Dehalococcoidia bacterium]|jgi:uncharacterized protein (DUF433 family)
MSSTAPFDIGTLITCTPGVYGGRPCLAGTRFPVSMVATHFATLGAEGIRVIVEDYGMDEVKVHAAVAYYLANKRQFDEEMAEEERFWSQLQADAR